MCQHFTGQLSTHKYKESRDTEPMEGWVLQYCWVLCKKWFIIAVFERKKTCSLYSAGMTPEIRLGKSYEIRASKMKLEDAWILSNSLIQLFPFLQISPFDFVDQMSSNVSEHNSIFNSNFESQFLDIWYTGNCLLVLWPGKSSEIRASKIKTSSYRTDREKES